MSTTGDSKRGSTLLTKAKKLVKIAHDFVKQEKYVSRALDHFGYKHAAVAARAMGYGKRRRVVRRRRRVV